MLTKLFTRLASTKPPFYTQINQPLNLTVKKKKHLIQLNSKFTIAASLYNTTPTPVKPAELPTPTIIPDFPPKGPRPELPELPETPKLPKRSKFPELPDRYGLPELPPRPERDFEKNVPSKNPEITPYTIPDFVPSKPSEIEPKTKPQRGPKVKPKRKKDGETNPFKKPAKQPLPSPEEPKKPKRFRRRRVNRVMIDLTELNFTAKQLTEICKKFPFVEPDPNSKLKFKPDPESNRIEPGIARALGRRKSSIAQVKLTAGKGNITINGKPAAGYLQSNLFLLTRIEAPLYFLSLNDYVSLSIYVKGGGLIGQADAIKLGISRALCNYNMDYRYPLRNKGYLTRDARVKERKKYGLRKARKAPQYSKR